MISRPELNMFIIRWTSLNLQYMFVNKIVATINNSPAMKQTAALLTDKKTTTLDQIQILNIWTNQSPEFKSPWGNDKITI